MRNGSNGENSTDTSPITSWYDLANKSREDLSDIILFASFAGIDGVFETWETSGRQKGSGARTNTTQPKVVIASDSTPLPLGRMAFVREGVQWKNTLLVDVDVDLDYVLLSFCEDAEMRADAQGEMSVLRFDGPIVSGQHPLILTLKQPGNLLLALEMYAAGSDEKRVMKLDLISIPSPQL